MLPGVYQATKKDGSTYYRSNITYKNKHISLGSFPTEKKANQAYQEAGYLLKHPEITPQNAPYTQYTLSFDKCISLMNLRDNHIYIKNPIYLFAKHFLYFLTPTEYLRFDIDDLFFYSSHKIHRRKGHLYVNDYGMQISLLSRYGIKNYAVPGKDYEFANGDSSDYSYSNIIILSKYTGVRAVKKNGTTRYHVYIHINGNYKIGSYQDEKRAAIAYNKAVDLAKAHGVDRNYSTNYVEEYSAREYADLYTKIKISKKYLNYLASLS